MSTPPEDVAPRPSATVLLLRERAAQLEVLMLRRNAASRFMAGAWVFPGGAVEAVDSAPAVIGRFGAGAERGLARRLGARGDPPLSDLECLALCAAAIRETFEEAGVLIARPAHGGTLAARIERLQGLRAALVRRPEGFAELLAAQELLLDATRLVCWSRWITPRTGVQRFDTRFFAVAMPEEQTVSIDAAEAVEARWTTPRAMLEARTRGEAHMVPPTACTLEDLELCFREHGSAAAMLAAEANRAIPPLMPRVKSVAGSTTALMPWDQEYATADDAPAGADAPPPAALPAHLRRLTSRFALQDPRRFAAPGTPAR